LHVEEGVVRIHLTGKHAAEFEFGQFLFQPVEVGDDGLGRVAVAFVLGDLQQVGGIVQAAVEALQGADGALQGDLFAAQVLRALRVFPELRVFQLAIDFDQPFRLAIEIKDTP
jgi:hypothetical protein